MRRALARYAKNVVAIYRRGGLADVLRRTRTHLLWRWHRTRIHPRVRGAYATWLTLRRLAQPRSFTDADPFKVVYVDPAEIELVATELPVAWARVIGGEWNLAPYEERYWVARMRYLEGRAWSEIPYQVDDPERWDRLYRAIREYGYRSQRELAQSSSEPASDDDWTWDCEVGVGIDRDGEIVWIGRGYHRLTIAKILEVDAIPVQIRIRHPAWQAIRDEIRAAESATDLSARARASLDHPDLDDLRRSLLETRIGADA